MLAKPKLTLATVGVIFLSGCGGDGEKSKPAQPAKYGSSDAVQTAYTAEDGSSNFSSENKTFQDWTAVCDNINTCTAYGKSADNDGYVLVSLAAGPTAKPSVVAGSFNLPGAEYAIRLIIDGQAFNGRMEGQAVDNPLLLISQPSDQLLRSIAQGRQAHLGANDQSVNISLSGAAAAFLWIDERQGRLGTTTALIRKGPKPANSVPEAPSPPRLTPARGLAQTRLPTTLAHQVSALPEVRECLVENAQRPSSDEDFEVHRLGSNLLLWGVPCGSGAYNFAHIYALSANDGTSARLASLPSPGEPQTVLINSSFDAATNSLGAYSKGRGIGDCGEVSAWQWTGEGFELSSQYVMSDCLGITQDYWPSTWATGR